MISIHALLAESDRQNPGEHYVAFRFLSTLSLRRATPIMIRQPTPTGFLSTLSLRRATFCLTLEDRKIQISIHALLAESDDITDTVERMIGKFLSTLSLRRATRLGL